MGPKTDVIIWYGTLRSWIWNGSILELFFVIGWAIDFLWLPALFNNRHCFGLLLANTLSTGPFHKGTLQARWVK